MTEPTFQEALSKSRKAITSGYSLIGVERLGQSWVFRAAAQVELLTAAKVGMIAGGNGLEWEWTI
jgi:hypothetical protein